MGGGDESLRGSRDQEQTSTPGSLFQLLYETQLSGTLNCNIEKPCVI